MSKQAHSLPEPQLPEHQLISDAAPELELSANFRSEVLTECAASYAMAQKVFYAKVIASCLAAALAVFSAFVWWNQEVPEAAARQEATTEAPEISPGKDFSPGFQSPGLKGTGLQEPGREGPGETSIDEALELQPTGF